MGDTAGKTQFWPILRTAFIALNNGYWPAIESAAKARGIESPAWQYLLYILVFKGESLSAAGMRVRGPYTSARFFAERFETLARLGYLSRESAGRATELHTVEPRVTGEYSAAPGSGADAVDA